MCSSHRDYENEGLLRGKSTSIADQGSDVIDALPAALWHRIFSLLLERRCIATPPHSAGGRYYCRALSAAQRAELNATKANANGGDRGAANRAGTNDPRNAESCASSSTGKSSNGKCEDEGKGSAGESDEEEEEAKESVVFVKAGVSPCWLHAHNARTFGSSWPLLCCALASKRLLHLVASFSMSPMLALPLSPSLRLEHGTPISLHLTSAQPQWTTSVRWLLSRSSPTFPSLRLSFSHPSLIPLIRRPFTLPSSPAPSSISSLHLTLSIRESFPKEDYRKSHWYLAFLTPCSSLHSLTLGRGAWRLALAAIAPQLHEFTFCEPHKVEEGAGRGAFTGPVLLCLEFPRARHLSFRFLNHELKLKLSLASDSLTSFAASALSLTLACHSARPLTLTQLFLFGEERIHIASFDIASVRALYLNAPVNFLSPRPAPIPAAVREAEVCGDSFLFIPPPLPFAWADWLRALAPTVELLIARHDIKLADCKFPWPRLRSLGIVVESDYFAWNEPRGEMAVEDVAKADGNEYVQFSRDQRSDRREEGREREHDMWSRGLTRFHASPFGNQLVGVGPDDYDGVDAGGDLNDTVHEAPAHRPHSPSLCIPPSINSPNLRAIFFPTLGDTPTALLGDLKARYPSLALYCVARHTWYWERKGMRLIDGPVAHVRGPRGGKGSASFRNGRKSVRDKMHSVNLGLMAGYRLDEEEWFMVEGQLWFPVVGEEEGGGDGDDDSDSDEFDDDEEKIEHEDEDEDGDEDDDDEDDNEDEDE
ncbi:unnamed protein product [Closterium sp. NIES-64]|nr:unnamed protein product [Closterium sp. NIES-65]CAI5988769.1 unnamed protein product [Closterium sp. NIES-64]